MTLQNVISSYVHLPVTTSITSSPWPAEPVLTGGDGCSTAPGPNMAHFLSRPRIRRKCDHRHTVMSGVSSGQAAVNEPDKVRLKMCVRSAGMMYVSVSDKADRSDSKHCDSANTIVPACAADTFALPVETAIRPRLPNNAPALPQPSRSARLPDSSVLTAELPLLLAALTKSPPLSDRGLRGESAARGDGVACALKPAARGSSRTTPRPGADSSGSSSGYRSDAFAQLTCRCLHSSFMRSSVRYPLSNCILIYIRLSNSSNLPVSR